MKEQKNINIFIITTGLFLWTLYLCDSEMARYGIYTIFSYNMHEILATVPFLSFIIIILWLIYIIANSVRKTHIKPNISLFILLLVIFFSQFIYIYNQSKITSTSCVVSIESIDREKLEINVISGEKSFILECPILVQDLLKTDGTEYYITYEWKESNPNYSKLCMIQSINKPLP